MAHVVAVGWGYVGFLLEEGVEEVARFFDVDVLVNSEYDGLLYVVVPHLDVIPWNSNIVKLLTSQFDHLVWSKLVFSRRSSTSRKTLSSPFWLLGSLKVAFSRRHLDT